MAIILLCFGFSVGCGDSGSGAGCAGKGLHVFVQKADRQGPDFRLPALDDSAGLLRLSEQYRETPVLLVFWATWCPSCVKEIPQLNALHEKWGPDRLRILAVNVRESREKLTDFAQRRGIRYPVLLDETGGAAAAYEVTGLPVAVVLAKGGEILYYGITLPEIENYI